MTGSNPKSISPSKTLKEGKHLFFGIAFSNMIQESAYYDTNA